MAQEFVQYFCTWKTRNNEESQDKRDDVQVLIIQFWQALNFADFLNSKKDGGG